MPAQKHLQPDFDARHAFAKILLVPGQGIHLATQSRIQRPDHLPVQSGQRGADREYAYQLWTQFPFAPCAGVHGTDNVSVAILRRTTTRFSRKGESLAELSAFFLRPWDADRTPACASWRDKSTRNAGGGGRVFAERERGVGLALSAGRCEQADEVELSPDASHAARSKRADVKSDCRVTFGACRASDAGRSDLHCDRRIASAPAPYRATNLGQIRPGVDVGPVDPPT